MGDIVMPRLSDTMEEGTILHWLLSDGESVSRGQELVEIETDKATMVYESDQDGTLQTVAVEGQTLAVGELIARVGLDADAPAADAGGEPPVDDASPNGGRESRARADEAAAVATTESSARAPATSAQPAGERVKASPVARRIAHDSGVDLHTLSGTGPGGRIVKADVQDAAAARSADAPSPPTAGAPLPPPFSPDAVATAKGQTTVIELSRTQQTIARRMAESKATIPDFTLQIDVDMSECLRLRTELKRLAQPQAPAAPTYNDMIVKACALALREHPRVNGSYRDGRLQLYSRVNVGVAVAADGALVVPTVFDAEEKSLGEIARETRALAERVRAGTITPPELGGGTFTVSNLGMYGIRSFAAIINPPQAAILSVGSVGPRAVVREEAVVSRPLMTLTLACDHRILYGADAALFLARIRALLEQPTSLTL